VSGCACGYRRLVMALVRYAGGRLMDDECSVGEEGR